MLNRLELPLVPNAIDEIPISIQKEAGSKRQVYVQMTISHAIETVW